MSYVILENGDRLALEDSSGIILLELSAIHDERLLEDSSYRLLENISVYRALENVFVPPTPPAPTLIHGNQSLQYIQNELPFLRCNICNRKSYQIEYLGVTCNAWNSAPSKYPGQYCPGVLVPSIIAVLPQLEFQLVLQERANS